MHNGNVFARAMAARIQVPSALASAIQLKQAARALGAGMMGLVQFQQQAFRQSLDIEMHAAPNNQPQQYHHLLQAAESDQS